MGLEDFEKQLAEEKAAREVEKDRSRRKRHGDSREHRHRHRSSKRDVDEDSPRRRRHKEGDTGREADDYDESRRHSHKRARYDDSSPDRRRRSRREAPGTTVAPAQGKEDELEATRPKLQRDVWMEAPSAEEVTYLQASAKKEPESQFLRSSELQAAEPERIATDCTDLDAKQSEAGEDGDVDFTFGDSGSKWRMTKLKAVYSIAKDTGRSIEEIAINRYGSLRAFDNGREEENELERRRTYGEGYVGKERPSGELYLERKLRQREDGDSTRESEQRRRTPELASAQTGSIGGDLRVADTVQLDQTALNKLRARMMKAKLKGSSEFAELEQQYTAAMAGFANRKEPDIVVLGPMESRMLAARRGRDEHREKGGRKRGGDLEEMTIEDMVREERMTKNQAGGDGRRFAERIAKDAKFDNDLEYLDENAAKLAKRIDKSEISLKNTAISDLQRMNRILDRCPLCYHDDTNKPPLAPVVSLATRVYLTLPTEPEIVSPAKGTIGGACIVPLQHRVNLLECDDDEWEEIRNFMKCLKRMYHDQGRDVVFYENAAAPQRRRHAAMGVIPLPRGLAADAPAFFKESILSQAASWSQHRPLIDTLARARSTENGGGSNGGGLGKLSFRRSIAKEAPYFHVWFDLDGGLGHVVEDEDRWPKGDVFARETLGGMLDAPLDVVRKQGRWTMGPATNERVERFRMAWQKWDWTGVLHG